MNKNDTELEKLIAVAFHNRTPRISMDSSEKVITYPLSSESDIEEIMPTQGNKTLLSEAERTFTSQTVLKTWHIIHPESSFKKTWNTVLVFLLLYTAIIMPYNFAFIEENNYDSWWWLDSIINVLFFIDIIINCFLAYYDDYGYLIYSHFKILGNYFKTWMIIDLIGCVPLDYFVNSGSNKGYNKLLRLIRLPRLYKLIKIPKNRKPDENRNKLLTKILTVFKFKQSISRLIKVFISVIICIHISACFWRFLPKLKDYSPDTWLFSGGYLNENQYIISVYWCIVTFSTVGYGDISAKNSKEIIFAILWMFFGICFYSFIIGSLASINSSLENR